MRIVSLLLGILWLTFGLGLLLIGVAVLWWGFTPMSLGFIPCMPGNPQCLHQDLIFDVFFFSRLPQNTVFYLLLDAGLASLVLSIASLYIAQLMIQFGLFRHRIGVIPQSLALSLTVLWISVILFFAFYPRFDGWLNYVSDGCPETFEIQGATSTTLACESYEQDYRDHMVALYRNGMNTTRNGSLIFSVAVVVLSGFLYGMKMAPPESRQRTPFATKDNTCGTCGLSGDGQMPPSCIICHRYYRITIDSPVTRYRWHEQPKIQFDWVIQPDYAPRLNLQQMDITLSESDRSGVRICGLSDSTRTEQDSPWQLDNGIIRLQSPIWDKGTAERLTITIQPTDRSKNKFYLFNRIQPIRFIAKVNHSPIQQGLIVDILVEGYINPSRLPILEDGLPWQGDRP